MDYIVDLVPLLQDESYRATCVILSAENGKWSYDTFEILYYISLSSGCSKVHIVTDECYQFSHKEHVFN